MSDLRRPVTPLPVEVLYREDMLSALREHDFGRAFFLARKWGGISYSAIAEAAGIKPERVGSLARGRGEITSYAKVCDVADALRIPGRLVGLPARPWETHDPRPAPCTVQPTTRHDRDTGNVVDDVRHLLAHAAAAAMGISAHSPDRWGLPGGEPTPTPRRVTAPDVDLLEATTRHLRDLDYRHGGGACHQLALAQTRWATQLLDVPAETIDVTRRLHVALADLHNLSAWTSFDLGLYTSARRHFAHAITHSRIGDDASLLANVLYRTGRLHLHCGLVRESLRFFQLGQITAQDTGEAAAVAVLCANEAWAYSMLGDTTAALSSLDRAADELSRSDPHHTPPWVRFFTPTDLQALTGMAHLELARTDTRHLTPAREALTTAVAARDDGMTRSMAFETTALAVTCLRDGDTPTGLDVGEQAVGLAETLNSRRVIDRLTPLRVEAADTRGGEGDHLATQITRLQTT